MNIRVLPASALLLAFSLSGGQQPEQFLHLDSLTDQRAFRSWFTFLAEIQAFTTPPEEVNDCAALVRFAMHEALRRHDGAWANEAHLPILPPLPDVQKYHYPLTAVGPGIFRTDEGHWGEFADAKTLQRFNSYFLTREIAQAQPGDLLFYRQLTAHMPFHVMIYLGRSQVEHSPAHWLIYHTGPSINSAGEIRRVTMDDLMRHPSRQWRPLAGNPNFLGVYRLNILRRT